MIRDVDFSKKLEYNVEVYCDDEGVIGEGLLSFGSGGLIFISLGLGSCVEINKKDVPILKAKTKEGQRFTLFKCVVEREYLYADFVVLGDVGSEIKFFEVKYGDISDWFLHGRYVSGAVGESIEWKNPAPQLSVCIKTAGEDFSLRTYTFGSLKESGEDYIIHEHTRFVFERDCGFSVFELKEKSFELSSLLSVLTANPISITSVWIGFDAVRSPLPIYFSAFKKVDRGASSGAFWLSCLAQRESLDEKWQLVFDRYYGSAFRKTTWIRLAGMQRYEGFWEFNIFGYVSLLDEYVSSYSALYGQIAPKPENVKVEKFIRRVKGIKPPLDVGQIESLSLLAESVFRVRRELTFRDKYDYAIGLTDKDVLSVVSLTSEDFFLIKKIRDKVAHGNTPDLTGGSYQGIHCIVEKIALLITYWAHNDLGFSASDFLASLRYTHNKLSFNPRINKVHLDRVTGSAKFISVSEPVFRRFESGDGPIVNACFTQGCNGELVFSEEYKAAYDAWIGDRNRQHKQLFDVFGVAQERFRFVGTLYLEFGEKVKELHAVYIIKDV